jgi:hypothetical protein
MLEKHPISDYRNRPMKTTNLLLTFAILCTLAGCANPGMNYADAHPNLSPEHRRIMLTGKIPDGADVAGLTKEEIRLAEGADPDQFTKVDGMDAWVYIRQHSRNVSANDLAGHEGRGGGEHGGSSWGNHEPEPGNTAEMETEKGSLTTTIIFQGDRAIRAQVSREKI